MHIFSQNYTKGNAMKYLLLSLLLIGCGTFPVPSQKQWDTADFGTYPENYEEIAKQYIRENFNDPNSITDFEVAPPVKAYTWADDTKTILFGYKIVFKCNAKNAYGGYTGIDSHRFFVRNGVTRRFYDIQG